MASNVGEKVPIVRMPIRLRNAAVSSVPTGIRRIKASDFLVAGELLVRSSASRNVGLGEFGSGSLFSKRCEVQKSLTAILKGFRGQTVLIATLDTTAELITVTAASVVLWFLIIIQIETF